MMLTLYSFHSSNKLCFTSHSFHFTSRSKLSFTPFLYSLPSLSLAPTIDRIALALVLAVCIIHSAPLRFIFKRKSFLSVFVTPVLSVSHHGFLSSYFTRNVSAISRSTSAPLFISPCVYVCVVLFIKWIAQYDAYTLLFSFFK